MYIYIYIYMYIYIYIYIYSMFLFFKVYVGQGLTQVTFYSVLDSEYRVIFLKHGFFCCISVYVYIYLVIYIT